jgi:hypothetical protein
VGRAVNRRLLTDGWHIDVVGRDRRRLPAIWPMPACGSTSVDREDASALTGAEAARATVTEPPRDRPWRIYSGYFRDPDGHLWRSCTTHSCKPRAAEDRCVTWWRDAFHPGNRNDGCTLRGHTMRMVRSDVTDTSIAAD